MQKVTAQSNIVNKKSIIIGIVSFTITLFLTKSNKNKYKKKNSDRLSKNKYGNKKKIKTYKFIYSLLSGIVSALTAKKIVSDVKNDEEELVIEDAIIFDV